MTTAMVLSAAAIGIAFTSMLVSLATVLRVQNLPTWLIMIVAVMLVATTELGVWMLI